MRVVFILADSVNRRFLSCYGAEERAITPNIDRLAQRSCVFDQHWCGSAPCMPARRDILTGRLNFMERPWGGIEPFDQTLPELLATQNVYTHMETDHFHYSERGGENYWGNFTSWRLHRGAEHDTVFWGPDKTGIPHPIRPDDFVGTFSDSYEHARRQYDGMADRYATPRTYTAAAEWLERAHHADNFMLWVEGFSPHEPFDVPQEFLDLYPEEGCDTVPYWPNYETADHYTQEQIRGFRRRYKAALSMTDYYIGKILDVLDKYDMWKDTVVVFTTDHGYMLGEHGFLAKNYMPDYNEIHHIPLLVAAPHIVPGRCGAVTENIDMFPTMLELFSVDQGLCRNPIHGKSILPLLDGRQHKIRDGALFGLYGKTISVTDGKYVYMRAPVDPEKNQPLYFYGSMLSVLNQYIGYDTISETDFSKIELGHLSWTKFPVYRIPAEIIDWNNGSQRWQTINRYVEGNRLYDIEKDYHQIEHIDDPELESYYVALLCRIMRECDAPEEQFVRLGMKDCLLCDNKYPN